MFYKLRIFLLFVVYWNKANAFGLELIQRPERVTFQGLALASNAGGQEAYTLRLSADTIEYALFSNKYLLVGEQPLMGATIDARFSLCGVDCFVDAFVQIGVGGSNGGGIVELLWGTNLFWVLRMDVATHVIISDIRPVFWSYPLWIGLTIPI